jgi:mono/diheme cytochrome c family protein
MRSSLVVLSLAVLASTSCGTATPPTRAQTIAGLTGVAATGQMLYMQQCVSCHGPAGDASTISTNNKSMVAYVKANTAEATIGILIDGVPNTGMASFKGLSNTNLADLYAYVKNTLSK